jgi:hypothetical protein
LFGLRLFAPQTLQNLPMLMPDQKNLDKAAAAEGLFVPRRTIAD